MSADKKPEVKAGEEDEGNFTRRAFLKFLLGTSVILSIVPFVPMVKFFFTKKTEQGSSRKRIANVKELPEGLTKVFFYPGEEDIDRSFLVHLPQALVEKAKVEGKDEFINQEFVAFNTICPHLLCPVEFPEEDEFVCPCHGGYFNIVDGSVVDGPPKRPLPAIRLEVEKDTGDIYAVELIGKIGYGRE